MNRRSYAVPKAILYSLTARLCPNGEADPPDPLATLSPKQLTDMVKVLIRDQDAMCLELDAEEERIKDRLLAETRRRVALENDFIPSSAAPVRDGGNWPAAMKVS